MGPVVRSLILKRFRSVAVGRVDFDNPTFLVGRNGSGKSNIADALAFLAEAMTSPLPEVLDRRGGIANILHKTPQTPSPTLGFAIEIDNVEVLRNSFEDFDKIAAVDEGLFARNIANARYSLEIGTLTEYGFEVDREQCVFTRFDGSKGWFDRRKKQLKTNVGPFAGHTQSMRMPESLALPGLPFIDAFLPVFQVLRSMRVYSIDPAQLREMQDPDSGTSLKRNGSNAASVLDEIKRRAPKNLKRIDEFLAAIVPETSAVTTVRHGKKLSLEFTQKWDQAKQLNFEAFNMSDGTLRAFGLLLAVFQRETPSLIVVEEPEASIHPGAAGAILDLLHHASRQMQVVVSTHSPDILDAKWIGDENLRVITWQKGATRVSNVSELSKKALKQHLAGAGELLRSEALEPSSLFEEVGEPEPSLFEEVH
jgi:predicted ATPase